MNASYSHMLIKQANGTPVLEYIFCMVFSSCAFVFECNSAIVCSVLHATYIFQPHATAEQFVKERLELYSGKMVESKLSFPYQYHSSRLLWLLHKDVTLKYIAAATATVLLLYFLWATVLKCNEEQEQLTA